MFQGTCLAKLFPKAEGRRTAAVLSSLSPQEKGHEGNINLPSRLIPMWARLARDRNRLRELRDRIQTVVAERLGRTLLGRLAGKIWSIFPLLRITRTIVLTRGLLPASIPGRPIRLVQRQVLLRIRLVCRRPASEIPLPQTLKKMKFQPTKNVSDPQRLFSKRTKLFDLEATLTRAESSQRHGDRKDGGMSLPLPSRTRRDLPNLVVTKRKCLMFLHFLKPITRSRCLVM